ncbi:MAG TPA: AAA family ATPase [Candidatus Andersenbacteria bacterium]|nr:AAA family ATPase [Candidatus Andersenbacteria bacterium]
MKTVFMTIGPQGAGKSTFCKRVITAHSDIILLSRDKLIDELFGGENGCCDSYSGAGAFVIDKLLEMTRQALESGSSDTTILLDCWTPDERHRDWMLRQLRERGAERVIGLYFVTSLETTVRWFVKRECKDPLDTWRQESNERVCRNNYGVFHCLAADVREGKRFDAVRRIKPEQLELFPEFVVL